MTIITFKKRLETLEQKLNEVIEARFREPNQNILDY